jgi:hypothetical protein
MCDVGARAPHCAREMMVGQPAGEEAKILNLLLESFLYIIFGRRMGTEFNHFNPRSTFVSQKPQGMSLFFFFFFFLAGSTQFDESDNFLFLLMIDEDEDDNSMLLWRSILE